MSLGTSAINAGATSWSNFWGGANSYGLLYGRAAPDLELSRVLGRQGKRTFKAVLAQLVGTAAGSTAVATYARISAPAGLTNGMELGGARLVETITDINRATTAADEAYVESVLALISGMNPAITSYATDASGNGGGGKVGV